MFDSLFDINKLDNKIVLTIIDNNNVDNINFNVLNKTFKWCGELNNINDLINLANNNDIKYNDITNINIITTTK